MSAVSLKRSLRPRKSINYMQIAQGKEINTSVFSETNDSTVNETDVSRINDPNFSTLSNSNVSDREATSESSGDELFSEKKPKISEEVDTIYLRRASVTLNRVSFPRTTKSQRVDKNADVAEILAATEDADEDLNEYRLQRQRQMLDREMILKSIDFDEDIEILKTIAKPSPVPVVVKRTPSSARRPPPVKRPADTIRRRSARLQNQVVEVEDPDSPVDSRRSARLGNRSFKNYTEDVSIIIGSEETVDPDYEIKENLDMASEEDNEFIASLKDAVNVSYDSVSDFTTCDFDKFKETLKLCHMFEEPAKVISNRIVSMDFHPSEKKLLLLIGDKYGNIALRDLASYEGIQIKGHQYNTNCLKFSRQNNAKFYSTSLDGTVRMGDINTSSLNLLYSTSVHTTWHEECGDTLYIAEGDGCVRLLDLRSPNNNIPGFQCHKRSVRTVQTHPLDKNYILTSSGTGYFGIWDVRQIKMVEPEPIHMESFTKGLTSAFYSAKGKYVLSTCNDDTIRVFDIEDNQTKSRISHSNHTGRWLSVFKAVWQPQREDCFYIGSMMQPRRMQAYTETGAIVREFRSDALNTVNSVITVHPTKPIIVGGNGSGKIHVFSPFRNLNDID